ncbi:MAG TPA: PAS domain-containing protein [Anaeromyxobacter sp.]|nr:PAS domain-containing protein [Anaeromyxobacter sp.]
MTSSSSGARLASAVLEALPVAAVAVDAALRIVHANALARALLGAAAGRSLADALGCPASGEAPRGAAAIRDAAVRALAGERVRARGFVLRTGARGEPADLHLIVSASPLAVRGAPHAVVVLDDADRLLLDPALVRICAGCGRVEDEEGEWHPLHRYLEDRLGLALDELCHRCARKGRG